MSGRWVPILVLANLVLAAAVVLLMGRVDALEESVRRVAEPEREVGDLATSMAASFDLADERQRTVEAILRRHIGPIDPAAKRPPAVLWRAACRELAGQLTEAELRAGGCP